MKKYLPYVHSDTETKTVNGASVVTVDGTRVVPSGNNRPLPMGSKADLFSSGESGMTYAPSVSRDAEHSARRRELAEPVMTRPDSSLTEASSRLGQKARNQDSDDWASQGVSKTADAAVIQALNSTRDSSQVCENSKPKVPRGTDGSDLNNQSDLNGSSTLMHKASMQGLRTSPIEADSNEPTERLDRVGSTSRPKDHELTRPMRDPGCDAGEVSDGTTVASVHMTSRVSSINRAGSTARDCGESSRLNGMVRTGEEQSVPPVPKVNIDEPMARTELAEPKEVLQSLNLEPTRSDGRLEVHEVGPMDAEHHGIENSKQTRPERLFEMNSIDGLEFKLEAKPPVHESDGGRKQDICSMAATWSTRLARAVEESLRLASAVPHPRWGRRTQQSAPSMVSVSNEQFEQAREPVEPRWRVSRVDVHWGSSPQEDSPWRSRPEAYLDPNLSDAALVSRRDHAWAVTEGKVSPRRVPAIEGHLATNHGHNMEEGSRHRQCQSPQSSSYHGDPGQIATQVHLSGDGGKPSVRPAGQVRQRQTDAEHLYVEHQSPGDIETGHGADGVPGLRERFWPDAPDDSRESTGVKKCGLPSNGPKSPTGQAKYDSVGAPPPTLEKSASVEEVYSSPSERKAQRQISAHGTDADARTQRKASSARHLACRTMISIREPELPQRRREPRGGIG